MFSHVTLGTNDFARARRFYLAVMGAIGHPVFFERDDRISFGTATGPKTFVGSPSDGKPARAGNGVHVAYIVATREAVDAFHAAALAHGGTDEGARAAPALPSQLLRRLRPRPRRQQAASGLPLSQRIAIRRG